MVALELELFGRSGRSNTSVLIGDDNDSFRSSLAEFFADHGFEVREAGDGAEVLSVARKYEPHLLLLDVRMPALSGLDAYQRLVEDLGRRLPAIFMTTGPTPEIRRQAQQLGAAALLDKVQIRLNQLHRLVAALLDGSMNRAEAEELIELLLDPRWAHELIGNAQALASAAALWLPSSEALSAEASEEEHSPVEPNDESEEDPDAPAPSEESPEFPPDTP